MTIMKNKLIFQLSLAAVCFSLASSAVQATPYSYASISLSNLALAGLSSPGVAVSSVSVRTFASASYISFPPSNNTAGVNDPANPLSSGSDVLEVTVGPGPFPGQNVFTQALLGSFGTRGDAVVSEGFTGSGSFFVQLPRIGYLQTDRV